MAYTVLNLTLDFPEVRRGNLTLDILRPQNVKGLIRLVTYVSTKIFDFGEISPST